MSRKGPRLESKWCCVNGSGGIREIYDGPTRRAIVSFGRKNGKTTLTAMLLLCHLVGPCAVPNSSIFSAAQSRDQAALVFALAAKMVRFSPHLNSRVTVRESRKELFCGHTGCTYRALSADASTAYGLSPAFAIHDELGLVRGSKSELFEAIESGMSAHTSPLSIIISTQAPSDGDLLSLLIDDAQAGNDPATKLFLYTAPEDADPFVLKAIRLANPALGDFLSETEVMAIARDAERMPSRESSFRNLILNQRVAQTSSFISRSMWEGCAAEPMPLAGQVYAGLDLGSVSDLTAWVAMSKSDAAWDVHPHFWIPGEDVAAKGRQDHFDYETQVRLGSVTSCPGRAVDWEMVANFVAREIATNDIRQIGFDRWRLADLKPYLLRAGISEQKIASTFVECGQGFQTMTRALDALERAILAGQVRHGSNPVLSWNVANSTVVSDDTGNRKLTKKKSHGRIDGVVAAAMAFFVAPLSQPVPEYQMLFIGGRQ